MEDRAQPPPRRGELPPPAPPRLARAAAVGAPGGEGPAGGGAACGGAAAAQATRVVAFQTRPSLRRLRRELVQLVDPQLLLDLGHLVHRLLEPLVAEEAVLLLLELVAQRVHLLLAQDLVQ